MLTCGARSPRWLFPTSLMSAATSKSYPRTTVSDVHSRNSKITALYKLEILSSVAQRTTLSGVWSEATPAILPAGQHLLRVIPPAGQHLLRVIPPPVVLPLRN